MIRGSLHPRQFFERYFITYDGVLDEYHNMKRVAQNIANKRVCQNASYIDKGYHIVYAFDSLKGYIPERIGGEVFYYMYVMYMMDTYALRNVIRYFFNIMFQVYNMKHDGAGSDRALKAKQELDETSDEDKNGVMQVFSETIKNEFEMMMFFIVLESYYFQKNTSR